MRLALVCATSFALLVVFAASGVAEDEDPAAALLTQLDELRKAEDASGLATAVAKVPEVYKGTENSGVRSKLRGELGKIVKDDDLGAARVAAVDALVALEDPKAVWKELSKSLPDRKTEEASELDLAVVRAAGKLAQSRAVKPLLELAAKAKDNKVAAEAAEALGGFREDKGRVKILEELISIGKRTRPGRSTDKGASQEAIERWGVVGVGIIKGLNGLTGRKETTFETWEELYDQYKKTPKDLFVE